MDPCIKPRKDELVKAKAITNFGFHPDAVKNMSSRKVCKLMNKCSQDVLPLPPMRLHRRGNTVMMIPASSKLDIDDYMFLFKPNEYNNTNVELGKISNFANLQKDQILIDIASKIKVLEPEKYGARTLKSLILKKLHSMGHPEPVEVKIEDDVVNNVSNNFNKNFNNISNNINNKLNINRNINVPKPVQPPKPNDRPANVVSNVRLPTPTKPPTITNNKKNVSVGTNRILTPTKFRQPPTVTKPFKPPTITNNKKNVSVGTNRKIPTPTKPHVS